MQPIPFLLRSRAPRTRRVALALALAAAGAVSAQTEQPAPAAAVAASGLGGELEQQVRRLALDGSLPGHRPGARVEVQVGTLDARLRLAPCQRIEPHLPANARLWGRTRIGLKCTLGATPWNVYLPLTVKVWARGWAASRALAAGTVLAAGDLVEAEIDLAAEPGAAIDEAAEAEAAIGRTLARPLDAGQGLRSTHFKPRLWFAAGDSVKIRAVGAGYTIESEGQALGAGIEGQAVRVRTDAGRVVSGVPAGGRRVDIVL